jgi:hypothetical protein
VEERGGDGPAPAVRLETARDGLESLAVVDYSYPNKKQEI